MAPFPLASFFPAPKKQADCYPLSCSSATLFEGREHLTYPGFDQHPMKNRSLPKSRSRKTSSAGKTRIGGPAMMNGAAYQLLWSVLRFWKTTIRDVISGPADLEPEALTLILEPSEGGDLRFGGVVEQIKTRSSGEPWSLEQVIGEVLPDLYKACRANKPPSRYRFVTESPMGKWEDVYAFFGSLRDRSKGQDPLSLLDSEHELASAAKNRTLATKVRKIGGGYTERGIFLYIAHVLREGVTNPGSKRAKKQGFQDSEKVLYGNMFRLLGGFDFYGGQLGPTIESEVLEELAARGVKDHELGDKLDSLVGSLLRRAREGEAAITRDIFLAQHRLQAIDLRNWNLITRESQFFVGMYLSRHRYQDSEDSRESTSLLRLLQAGAEEKPVIAWGESGQGKSWLFYRTAHQLAQHGDVVLLLDSTQEVARDRHEAARLFCEMIWGADEQLSLERLAHRVRCLIPEFPSGTWLTLLIDGVKDPGYLVDLSAQEWETLGIRVAVAFTHDHDDADFLPSGLHSFQVREFFHGELRRYLKLRLGEDSLLPPHDVQQLLKRPLMARLYCDRVAEGGQWQPKNEYQLIEGYWTGQASYAPLATDAITELASLLPEGEDYPWTLSRLRAFGIGEIDFQRLRNTHLVRLTHGDRTVELWHDRLLQWAIAEGLVTGLRAKRLTSENLQAQVRICLESDQAGRRFSYVPMDVLWLLAEPTASRENDVQEILKVLELIDGPLELVPTLGTRIVPHLFSRLRQISGDSSYSEIRYLEFLESIPDSLISGFAVDMLSDRQVRLQKTAVRILGTHGSPGALDRLWNLYRDWSRQSEANNMVEISPGTLDEVERINFYDIAQIDKALGNCVRSSPDWLEEAILNAEPENDFVHTLVFLIPKVVKGGELWRRVKKVAFEKVKPNHERCLGVCIASFHDREEIPWLRERIHYKKDFTSSMVRKALYLLAPEEALQPIDPESSLELALGRFWWLPPLQMEYPEQTADLLFGTIRRAENPWLAASFYDGRENWMSEEILDFLLDSTVDLLAAGLSESLPEKRLYRAFSKLEDISRRELLECFWKRHGKSLEKNLTSWLIREGPTDGRGRRLTPEAGLAVLRKIAGQGMAQVANAYLESAKTYWGRTEAFDLALRVSNKKTIKLLTRIAFMEQEQEFGSRTHPQDQREALRVLADFGCVDIVVRGILRWGLRLPPDFAEYLGGRVLSDTELAPAFEALAFISIPPGAILALGMSGRPEMSLKIISIIDRVEIESPQALACLISLETLGDQSVATENLFLRSLNVPDHAQFARRALARLKKQSESEGESEEKRIEDARRVWDRRHDKFFLFDQGEDLELLSLLGKDEEVLEFLSELAVSENVPNIEPSAYFAAVRALRKLDQVSAFDAALSQIERGPENYRKEYPKLLAEIDPVRAERALADLLRKSNDYSLIYAIGEALDRTAQQSMLLGWLEDSDPKLREGACFASEAMRWSDNLDNALFALRRAEDWDVWEAAWAALEKLRLQREVDRLVEAFHEETNRARRWALLDAVLDLGYPGIVDGYGRFGWFNQLNRERLPYSMAKYALEKLKKRREELTKKLQDRKRE